MIWRIVKKNLKSKSFAPNQKFLLGDQIIESRLDRCKEILNHLKKKRLSSCSQMRGTSLSTPSPAATQTGTLLRGGPMMPQITSGWSKNPNHPAQILMFGPASSNRMKMDPVYLPIGLRMGDMEYLELMLKGPMLPWIQTDF